MRFLKPEGKKGCNNSSGNVFKKIRPFSRQLFLSIGLFLILSFSNLQAEGNNIKILGVQGQGGISAADTNQIVGAVSNSFCKVGTSSWNCVNRKEGLTQLYEEIKLNQLGVTKTAVEVGKAEGANYVLFVKVDKLSSGSYTLDTELVHLESSIKIPFAGVSARKGNIDEMFDYAKDKFPADLTKNLNEASSTQSPQAEEKCSDLNTDTIATEMASCMVSNSDSERMTECFGTRLYSECGKINRSESCQKVCLVKGLTAVKAVIEEIAKKIEDCNRRGGELQADGSCKTKPPENRKKPDPVVPNENKSKRSDHNGWASIFVPGLGHGLKGRDVWGYFFFTTTLLAYMERMSSNMDYSEAKEYYNFPITTNSLALDYIWYDSLYKRYKNTADSARMYSVLFWGLYAANVFTAFYMDPKSSDFGFGKESEKTFSWDFGIYRETRQFLSSDKDIGTRYECNFLFRF